jgi:serine/threonine protein kinase
MANDDFQIIKHIASGSYGSVYEGELVRHSQPIAIKVESLCTQSRPLYTEWTAYNALSGGLGIPKVYSFRWKSDSNVLLLELLGPSIADRFREQNHTFSVKTVLMLADQMLSCLQWVHSKGWVHRDVKPENFAFGRGTRANQVFLLDFGFSTRFRDSLGNHRPMETNELITGTARYLSINSHSGITQSRRDDLESLAYILIYLIRGSLPWSGVECRDKAAKHPIIAHMKNTIPTAQLCAGLPSAFARFLEDTRALAHDERPNYALYRSRFRNQMIRSGFVYDCQYDWVGRVAPASTPTRENGAVRQRLKAQWRGVACRRSIEPRSVTAWLWRPLLRSAKERVGDPEPKQ